MKKSVKLIGAISVLALLLGVYGCAKKSNEEVVAPSNSEAEKVEDTTPDTKEDEEVQEDASAETEDVDTDADSDNQDAETEYPQIAFIEDEFYYGTGEICTMVPRKAPDGMIETIVSKEIMPDAHNSANFGAEDDQMEFMFLEEEGQLIIHIGEDWYYFEKQQAE